MVGTGGVHGPTNKPMTPHKRFRQGGKTVVYGTDPQWRGTQQHGGSRWLSQTKWAVDFSWHSGRPTALVVVELWLMEDQEHPLCLLATARFIDPLGAQVDDTFLLLTPPLRTPNSKLCLRFYITYYIDETEHTTQLAAPLK